MLVLSLNKNLQLRDMIGERVKRGRVGRVKVKRTRIVVRFLLQEYQLECLKNIKDNKNLIYRVPRKLETLNRNCSNKFILDL